MSHALPIQITLLMAFALAGCVAVVKLPPGGATDTADARPWPAAASCAVPPRAEGDRARVLTLVNAERLRAGLAPLAASPAIDSVAHAFACELARAGSLSHRGSDGSTLGERLGRGGISAALVAENVAAGQQSPEEVVADWMASPHHRENILRPGLARMGLGQADGAMPVWVLDLSS